MSSEQPIVSICCLVYNHEPFLRDCFDGFLMQKTNFPIEILVHDDASTDHSTDIIREYTEKYPNLFKPIYQTENQYSKGKGFVGITLNLERAQGKYIALCEGDDYWTDPLKLQKQVDFMESDNDEMYVMCFHDSIVVDTNGNIIQNTHLEKNQYQDLTGYSLMTLSHPPTQTILFRQKCYVEECKNIISSNRIVNQDAVLCYMLGKHGHAKYLPNILNSVYRMHIGGIWSMKTKLEHLEKHYELYSFLKEQDSGCALFYSKKKRFCSVNIVVDAIKESRFGVFLKYYFISNWLFLKAKDFKGIWNIQKGVVYNLIHK